MTEVNLVRKGDEVLPKLRGKLAAARWLAMRPLFHPSLVNGRYGDPTVYVETLFEKRSLLFDLGEIFSLPPRKIRRIDQVFVSHAHLDHFIGFDHLLRLLVGHEKSVQLFGPSGFAERVFHKLQAYRWNLVESYPTDLVFVVSELGLTNSISTTQFRLRKAFAAEPSVSRKPLPAYSAMNRPIACQPRSFAIAVKLGIKKTTSTSRMSGLTGSTPALAFWRAAHCGRSSR